MQRKNCGPSPLSRHLAGRAPCLRRLSGVSLLLLTLACGSGPEAEATERIATSVEVERVALQPVALSVRVPGLVEAKTRIELSFRVTGFLERYHVEEGDRVAAGTVLAELDGADLQREERAAKAALSRSRAEAQQAQRAFERQRKLLEGATTSRQRFDEADSAHQVAQAGLEEARVHLEEAADRLSKATLVAPIDATVERKLLEVHEVAPAQEPALVLADVDTVLIRGALAEGRATDLRVGQTVRIRSRLWPDRIFEGQVARIDVAADASTRTVPFEIDLPNPDQALRPESVVEVEVPRGEAREALTIPMAAVLRGADAEPFCLVMGGSVAEPVAERRGIELGPILGQRIAITAGLQEGDEVIVRGQHFVRDADPVRRVKR